ncbi:MAG: fibronectin type III domain-containing protein [Chitinispirillales bacterium]|nr:fibronectin type III domain-containing protein [Chitinispirillales bacterium]
MAIGSVSQSVDSLLAQSAPYSVTSSISGDSESGYGVGGAVYTGSTTGPLWEETNKMGKDQFLHLLTIQLKYQDPLSPMDNTTFVSQLAQFRALETSENTENAIRELGRAFDENLAAQIVSSQSIANSSAMSLIGHEARMRQTSISYDGKADTKVPIRVHLGNSDKVTVEIKDDDGNVVRTMAASGKDAQNSVTISWDGVDDHGQKAKAGKYSLNVVGSDKDASLYCYVQEVVEGVRFTGEGAMIKIGGKEISIGEVLDISMNDSGEGGGYITPSNALSMLGRTVRARYSEIRHTAYSIAEGVDYPINVNASRGSAVEVEIKNGRGDVVATLKGTANDFGELQLNWDGLTKEGDMAGPGVYTINVVGSDKDKSLYAYTEGVVDGITSLTGDFKMKVNGQEVALSDIISVTATSSANALNAPENIGITSVSSNSVTLGWSAVPGVTGYYVYRSTSPDGNYNLVGSTKSASFTNPGLTEGTTYYYKIAAYNNGGGESPKSMYISATTSAA